MSKQNKHLSIRLDSDLHQKLVDKAISKSAEENRIVKVSEIVRDIIEKGL